MNSRSRIELTGGADVAAGGHGNTWQRRNGVVWRGWSTEAHQKEVLACGGAKPRVRSRVNEAPAYGDSLVQLYLLDGAP